MTAKFESCPLTSQKANIIAKNSIYTEYFININGYEPKIRLSNSDDTYWHSDDTNKQKFLNFTLLYNKDWPIDEEIIITKALLGQIHRRHQFPMLDSTVEKMDYFLERIYREGGKNLESVKLPTEHYPYAYVDTPFKLRKIIDLLKNEDLIDFTFKSLGNSGAGQYKIDLKPKGEERAIKIQKEKLPTKISTNFTQHPSLLVIYDEKDKGFTKVIDNIFKGSSGTKRMVAFGNDHSSSTHTIDSLKVQLRDPSYYVIFIISENSKRNNGFTGALSLCYESKQNTSINYLYFGFIDDVDSSEFIVVQEFNHNQFDLRYNPDKISLYNQILKLNIDRVSQISRNENVPLQKKYTFPIIELTEFEKYWLSLVYDAFFQNEEIEISKIIAKEYEFFPKNFDPLKINRLLIQNGREITLLGIWHVKPESRIFTVFHKVMLHVKNTLKNDGEIAPLETKLLSPLLPDIDEKDLAITLKLLRHFSGFNNGWQLNSNKEVSIRTDDLKVIKNYLEYTNLESLMIQYVNSNNGQKPINELPASVSYLSDTIDSDALPHLRKNLIYQDPKEINGVLNVNEISEEVWTLIKEMPSEKGIFGIFGRWGRGKSFLINKIVEKIETHNKEGSKKYFTIEFDAWKYQDTPAAWAYLYQTLVEHYTNISEYWNILGLKINKNIWRLNLKKYGFNRIYLFLISLLLPFSLLFVNLEYKKALIVGTFSILGSSGLFYLYKFYTKHLPKAIELFEKYNTLANFKHLLGIQSEIQEEIIELVTFWINDEEKTSIILIIENLDRCDENKILPLIDSLRVILEEEKIAERMKIIAAIDESLISSCVSNKYKNLFKSEKVTKKGTEKIINFSSQYLDKVFIAGIRLNSLSPEDNGEMVLVLAENDLKREKVTASQIKNAIYQGNTRTEKTDELNENSNQPDQVETKLSSKNTNSESSISNKIENVITGKIDKKEDNIENSKNNSEENPELGYSIEEIKLLFECAKKHTNLTPRKIRIIYYRYYLAKNLLLLMHPDEKKNLWRNQSYLIVLIELLFKYSINKWKLDDVCNTQTFADTSNNDLVTIPDSDTKLKKEEYLKLLNVLQMVIIF